MGKPEVAVWLPPALRAALEGRELRSVEVPACYTLPVPHVIVSGSGAESLSLTLQQAPTQLEDGRLREGEVLVQMLAALLCLHELGTDTAQKAVAMSRDRGPRLPEERKQITRAGGWVTKRAGSTEI